MPDATGTPHRLGPVGAQLLTLFRRREPLMAASSAILGLLFCEASLLKEISFFILGLLFWEASLVDEGGVWGMG